MKVKSLKGQINRLIFVSILAFSIFIGGAVFLYYKIQSDALIDSSTETLLATTSHQANKILISYLIPEQQNGLEFLLEKFKLKENLTESKVVGLPVPIKNFKGCDFTSSFSHCVSDDNRQIGILAPIKEGEQDYGYYFKTKQLEPDALNEAVFTLVIFIACILLLALFMSFIILHKITSKVVPEYIKNLTEWLEEVLSGQNSKSRIHPGYAELDKLTKNIEQVVELHHQEKNNSIELAKSSAIGKIASEVVHDMKTPLTIISGAAKALKNGPEQEKNIEHIISAADQLDAIAEELLSKQRHNSPDSYQDKSNYILLHDLIDNCLSGIQPLAHQLGVPSLKIKSSIGLQNRDLKVFGNRTKLIRAIRNIITNALEAMSSQPQSEHVLSVTLSEKDNYSIIAISDTGPGIPDSISGKLLNERVTLNKLNGNGSGLVFANEVISAHDGNIDWQNIQPVGSRFTISLPYPPELKTVRISNQKPILVIDDDRKVLDAWRSVFKKEGVDTMLKTEFSEDLLQHDFSCVISDYDLKTQHNGVTVLKKFPHTVPRYLCTGYSYDPSILNLANDAGVFVLSKPVTKEKYQLLLHREVC